MVTYQYETKEGKGLIRVYRDNTMRIRELNNILLSYQYVDSIKDKDVIRFKLPNETESSIKVSWNLKYGSDWIAEKDGNKVYANNPFTAVAQLLYDMRIGTI